jgi:hypothetical protein
MMRAARIAVVSFAVSVALWSAAAQSQAQAADPLVGTWTLDIAKSTFSPGPPPKSITITFSETADGVKIVSDIVLPDGKPVHEENTAKTDGKDYPVTGSPFVDAISLTKKGNARTQVSKKDGKIVMTYDGVLSADGKTFTVQMKGTDPKGQPVNNSLLYVKKM